MTLAQARIEKILDEVGEAHREEARKLVGQFEEDSRVAVAEILTYAYSQRKFQEAYERLSRIADERVFPSQLGKIRVELGLYPTGAERS